MNNSEPYDQESGGVIVYVLLAVVLFAALGFAVSNMMRSSSDIGSETAVVTASEILEYSNALRQAVNVLRISNGCADDEISFERNPFDGSDPLYTNTRSPSDFSCHVFHPDGGGISFAASPTDRAYRFNGNNRIIGFGCDDAAAECSELLVELTMNDAAQTCLMINERVGTENPSGAAPQISDWLTGSAFSGTYYLNNNPIGGANVNQAPELKNRASGCVFENSAGQDTYHFYQILVAR